MNTQLAKLISYIFHPLALSVYAVMLMFLLPSWLSNYMFEYKKTIVLIIFLITLIIPALILLILLNLRIIKSLSLNERRDRFIPYAIIAFIYTGGYILLMRFTLLGIPASISNFILVADIIIIVLMLLNFRFKISAHMAGIGGFLSFFYVFLLKEILSDTLFTLFHIDFTILFFILFIIVISGLIASARMHLKEHNLSQILSGFFVGFFFGFLTFWM